MNTDLIPTEIENEAKSMLSKTEYEKILSLTIHKPGFIYKNNYFDNKTFFLLHHGHTLRSREQDNKYRVDFKVKNENGSLSEYQTKLISEKQHERLKDRHMMPVGEVRSAVQEFATLNSLDYKRLFVFMGYAVVYRIELTHKYGPKIRIYLDKTTFDVSGKVDYEIEVESDLSKEHAEEVLIDFMSVVQVLIIKSKSKYERFFANK